MNVINITTWSALGAALVLSATLLLPRHVSVARTATIAAAPETVLALAASNKGFQTINPYKSRDPDLKIDLFGPETGIGSGFEFDGKEGKGSQTVREITPDQVVYAIDLGALGQPTQSITAVAGEKGTEVTWRVDSDMGFNPIFRIFGLFMDGMMGPIFELGLANLSETDA